MKRRALNFFSIFTLLALVISASVRCEDKMMLWKVTTEDGGIVYLLGSVHAMKEETYPLPKAMEKAFEDSKFLVVEMDESKSDPAKMQTLVMTKGMYPAGDGLSKHLSKETMEKLKEVLPKKGIDPKQLEQAKPWMASIMLTMGELMKLGYDPKFGIDKHFLTAANTGKKKVLELESAEFQINLLANFNDELQEKFLLSSVMEMENMETSMKSMVTAWTAGNDVDLDKEINKQVEKSPELKPVFEKLFYERNVGMTAKVEEYLKTKEPHFVIAGAGHMVGDKGIVKLLKDKKYKVEQLAKDK